jgi:hypothetical protein
MRVLQPGFNPGERRWQPDGCTVRAVHRTGGSPLTKEHAMTITAPTHRPGTTTLAWTLAAVLTIGVALWVAFALLAGRSTGSTPVGRAAAGQPASSPALVPGSVGAVGQHSGSAAEAHFYGARPLVDGSGAPVVTTPTSGGATTGLHDGSAEVRHFFGSRGDR